MNTDAYYSLLHARHEAAEEAYEKADIDAHRATQEVLEGMTIEERSEAFFYAIEDKECDEFVMLIQAIKKAGISETVSIGNKLVDFLDEVVYNHIHTNTTEGE